MSTSNTAARRVLALLVLTILLLPAVLPAAGSHPPKAAPAESSFWSHPLQSLWRLALSAACVLDSNSCPVPTTTGGCDKGISIDPNGCPH